MESSLLTLNATATANTTTNIRPKELSPRACTCGMIKHKAEKSQASDGVIKTTHAFVVECETEQRPKVGRTHHTICERSYLQRQKS